MLLWHFEILSLILIDRVAILLVVRVLIKHSIMYMHISFQLLLNLLVDKLKKHLLVQPIVEVVRLVNSRN